MIGTRERSERTRRREDPARTELRNRKAQRNSAVVGVLLMANFGPKILFCLLAADRLRRWLGISRRLLIANRKLVTLVRLNFLFLLSLCPFFPTEPPYFPARRRLPTSSSSPHLLPNFPPLQSKHPPATLSGSFSLVAALANVFRFPDVRFRLGDCRPLRNQ